MSRITLVEWVIFFLISVIFAYVSGFDYLLGYRRARQNQQPAE